MPCSVTKTMWQDQGIGWLLDQWGLYLNAPAIDISYGRSPSLFVNKTAPSRIVIDGEIVDAINQWMTDLKAGRRSGDRQKAEVIELYHLRRKPFAAISNSLGMSRSSLMLVYAQATSWIDSKTDEYYKLATAKRRADDLAGVKRKESRDYEVVATNAEFGRSTMDIKCPFCQQVVTCFKRSLSGSGKKCGCGAKHTFYGGSSIYRLPSIDGGALLANGRGE